MPEYKPLTKEEQKSFAALADRIAALGNYVMLTSEEVRRFLATIDSLEAEVARLTPLAEAGRPGEVVVLKRALWTILKEEHSTTVHAADDENGRPIFVTVCTRCGAQDLLHHDTDCPFAVLNEDAADA